LYLRYKKWQPLNFYRPVIIGIATTLMVPLFLASSIQLPSAPIIDQGQKIVADALTQYASALFYVKDAVSILAIPGGAFVIRSYISEHAPLER
jgi:hypothetical protein